MNLAAKIRIAAFVVLFLGVELACRVGWISHFAMVPPSQMVVGLFQILSGAEIWSQIGATFGGVLIAAIGAVLVGFVLGVALHAWPRGRESLNPVLATYYAIPIYVFYPMLLVLLGLNRKPIILIAFMFAVVAMMTGTLAGLDRVPPVLLKAAKMFGMRRVATTMQIVLPAAAPFIFGGVKLALAYAFVGVIGAEFILSNTGLGYEIAYAFNNFDNLRMYALILFVVVVVAAINAMVFAWERVLLRRRQAT
jgi:NitT/TauT family transport system permease protein